MSSTSRQRVVDALHHRQPDLLPIDFASTRSTGINAYAYRALTEYLGLEEPIYLFDFKQCLAQPSPKVLELLGSDCLPLYRQAPSGIPIDRYKEVVMADSKVYMLPEGYSPQKAADGSEYLYANGIPILKRPSGGMYFDDCFHPLAQVEEELPAFPLPKMTAQEKHDLAERAKHLFTTTDKALVASSGISIFERGIKDWGYEEFLVRIYTEPELVCRYLEILTDAYLQFLDDYLDAVGPYVQVIQCNDDLGMQTGPLIAPKVYQDIFKPFHSRIFEYIHKKAPGVSILLHSCGGIFDLIPDLIDAGVDALNPVQTDAANMDPAALKREFGKDITFWGGGCSTQKTLTFAAPEEIRKEVYKMAEIFSPGGGFVFNQVHNIQSNISPDRVLTLYRAILEWRETHRS